MNGMKEKGKGSRILLSQRKKEKDANCPGKRKRERAN